MLDTWTGQLTEPLARPIEAVKGLVSNLPVSEWARLLPAPRALGKMAMLQCAILGHRYLTPVLIARELRFFEALEPAPLTLEALAERCDMPVSAAETLARILESEGLVIVDSNQVCLSELGHTYLTDVGPVDLTPTLDLLLAYTRSFSAMAEGIRAGRTADALDVRNDTPVTEMMLEAVNAHLDNAAAEFFSRATLPDIESAIVGSMGVSFSAELLRRHPQAKVTYGCLPHLVERIPRLRLAYEVPAERVDGMHAHSGEPASDTWGDESFDLVFLTRKMILDPDEGVGRKFVEKAFRVLEPGGVVVLWEAVHPDRGTSPLGLALETVFDLGMSPQAPLKTHASLAATLRRAGFGRVDVVSCLGGSTTFAVAHKA